MEYIIEDQLIKGFEFGPMTWFVSEEQLISEVTINTLIYGVSYYNGVLTVDQPILMGSSSTPEEAYIDENKILKLK